MRFRKASALVLAFFLVVSFFVVFPFGVFPVPLGHAASANWANTNLSYRQSEVVNSASGANVSYQVQLTIVNSSGSSSGNVMKENNHTRSDFGDVRFYSNDNSTGLNYWQQNVTSGGNSTFWVQMPSNSTYGNLSSSSQTIWVYYGNSTVTTSSSGVNTFLFFDNFANTSKWISKVGSWSANSNVMNQTSITSIGWVQQTAHWGIMTNSYSLPNTYALGVQLSVTNAGGVNYIGVGEHNNSNTPGVQAEIRQYTGASYLDTEQSSDYNGTTGLTIATSKWYSVELRKQNSTYMSFYDPSITPEIFFSSSYLPSNGNITLYMYDGIFGAQNLYVRKYVNPGPGNGVWTAEELYSAVSYPLTAPTLNDFYINSTSTNTTISIIANVSDSVNLSNVTFWNDNGTGGAGTLTVTNVSGTGPTNVTFTVGPYSVTTLLNFSITLCNTNSTFDNVTTTGYRTLAIYNTSMPYTSLGKAITAVEGANNWTTSNDALGTSGVDPYQGLILNQNTTAQYESVIDGYAAFQPTTITNATFNSYTIDKSSGVFTWKSGPYWDGNNYVFVPDNASFAIDNNTKTGAEVFFTNNDYSYYLILNFSSVKNVNNVELFCTENNATDVYIDVLDVYTTSWFTIFSIPQQITTWNNYFNVSVQQSIVAMRLQVHSMGAVTFGLNETQGFNAYVNHTNYLDALKYSAYAQKMNLTWGNQHNDLIYALGNISLCGSLPLTNYLGGLQDFGIGNRWALYAYYYANNSWVPSSIQTKWNATAAEIQYNATVYYGIANSTGFPFDFYNNGTTGNTAYTRYYDEFAEDLDGYLLFYFLLNQTDGLTQALYWWNYFNAYYGGFGEGWWSTADGGYYRYTITNADPVFELSAGWFLTITSIFKYYYAGLPYYSRVLTDISNRFLSNEWNSYQWLYDYNVSLYAVAHEFQGNDESRLDGTAAAWQALIGAYLQMNSGNQTNMKDMLSGNTTSNNQPAWSLLMSLTAGLWNSTTKLFKENGAYQTSPNSGDARWTAEGEILMFQMGIIPGTSTVAFPLEEIDYLDLFNIDPVLMAFNLNQTARQVTVPVVQAGTITFQYGESPITYNFNSSGVYLINFSSSWNNITGVSYKIALPTNVIYFYAPPPFYSTITVSSHVWGTASTLSCLWTANYGNLSGFIVGCNNTGTFINQSWTGTWSTWVTSQSAWANYTIPALNSTNSNATCPETIIYKWWANSTSNSWAWTGLETMTLYWSLSTGWNNVTIFTFDVGWTLGGLNASLNYDSINWTYIVYQNSSTSAQYVFANGMSYNNLVKIYYNTTQGGILLIFCGSAGSWTHTHPLAYQGGIYGSDPTPAIIAAVALAIGLSAYLVWRRRKKRLTVK